MNHTQHHSNESTEDYLETILLLQKQLGQVRSIDIATTMNFSKASVSVAMKKLREKEYITVADNGFILLTDKGRTEAESVLEKHTILSDWLIRLGVSEEIARMDACRMEHDISEESYAAIKSFINNIFK